MDARRKHKPLVLEGPAIERTVVGDPTEFNYWKRKIKMRERRDVIKFRIKARTKEKAEINKPEPSKLIEFKKVKEREANRDRKPVASSLVVNAFDDWYGGPPN